MRRALCVGIDDYPEAPLAGCVNDATELARVLKNHYNGAPNFDVKLITAPTDQITRPLLRESITSLFEAPAEIALLYLSGHGTENNLGGYYVTQDADIYDEGVSLADVLTLANNSPVTEAIILIDCCHSGALGQLPAIDNNKTILRQGISILTASRSSEVAVERRGMGLFTSLLVGALEGGASNTIGNVTVAGAYSYIDESLGAWDQRPLFKAHVTSMTTLRQTKPAIDVAILRQLPEWFTAPDALLQLDSSYEPDALPQHDKNEAIFACLQKCRSAKLIEPVDEEHMYYAAMRSKSCRLTPLGAHYWRLANEGRI